MSTKVTRGEFEEVCAELFAKITAPIDTALANAGMEIGNIDAVELLGGSVRMPKVKALLDEYFSKATVTNEAGQVEKVEVGQHLNGDEAMALGAAFRAANLSTSFRVRKVGMWDSASFGVEVELENLQVETKSGWFGKKKDASDGETWHKKTPLWHKKTLLPAKSKTVAIVHNQDIQCRVQYGPEDAVADLPRGTDKLLAVYNITGIADFAKEHESKDLGSPKVHLSFALDASGVVSLTKAEATLDLPAEPEEEEKDEETKEETKDEKDEETRRRRKRKRMRRRRRDEETKGRRKG